eukprot:TRINITY_DN1549_c0_g1_i7.p1 TRINITY_DN1549_c0_g1~~TRINITY_DN1549_c0_g1_i7.p1  ORF type:complete len:107 (-),score=8.27 TRINITY_DN1549_c0_g1_i7:327-647(-)
MVRYAQVSSSERAAASLGSEYETYHHRGARWPPLRQVLLSLFLLGIGTTFLIAGPLSLNSDYDRGVAFIVLGVVAFLPGSFSMFVMVQVQRGMRGYSYAQLPDVHF